MATFWKTQTVWNKKPKTKKPPSPEDACWRAFSKYIRTRDCMRTTGTMVAAKCVTCPKISAMKGNDAGHFISRGKGSVKYDPRNCHIQCQTCNRFQQGNWFEYRKWMLEFYGEDAVNEIETRADQIEAKWIDWKMEAARWRERTRELANLYGQIGVTQAFVRAYVGAEQQQGTLEKTLDDRIEIRKMRKL